MHVLSTPPAFVLSQNQTLRKNLEPEPLLTTGQSLRPSSLTKKKLKSDHSKPLSYCRLDYCRSPMFASRCSSDLKSQNKIPSQFRRTGAGKFLIKETRRITHNSIFADLKHSRFRTIKFVVTQRNREPNCQRSIALALLVLRTNRPSDFTRTSRLGVEPEREEHFGDTEAAVSRDVQDSGAARPVKQDFAQFCKPWKILLLGSARAHACWLSRPAN